MKKLIALLLALCLCLGLVACGGEGNKDDAPQSDVTLNVWAIENSAVTDYATNGQSVWMQEQTGINVNWMAVPAQGWYNAFQASVMGEEAVDIYLYPFDTMETEMLGNDMSYIIPLEDLITKENTPNIWAILEANPSLKAQITTPSGHIYTLFANDVYQLNAYTQKLWVNRYFLEKYTAETGKGLPQTTAEFEAMLVYFNTHDMNGDGQQNEIPYIGVDGVDGMYNLFGAFLPTTSNSNGFGCYTDESGKLTFAYHQEAYRDALAYAAGLYKQGLIHADTFTTSYDERYAFTSGMPGTVRAGVVTGVTAADVVQLSSESGSMTYDDYVALPPLAGPNGVRTIVSTGETAVSLRNAITKHCTDPVAAIKWLDAGYSDAARMFSVYGGLENEAWSYADGENLNGKGKIITSLNTGAENAYWGSQGIVCRITEEDYLSMDATQIATNSDLATYRANLAYRPYMVQNQWPSIIWPSDFGDEPAEYGNLIQLINPTVTEYYTAVILGQKNLDGDWDVYTKNLSELGVDRFVELVELYINAGK